MKDRVCTWKNPIDIEFKKKRKKKNGISLSLKDYALLRKIKDYMVFLPPKTLTLFCSLSLPRFLLVVFSFLNNILLL